MRGDHLGVLSIMPPASKQWRVAPFAPQAFLQRFSHLNPLVAQILYNRGVTDPVALEGFLNGQIRFDNPLRLLGMPEAVERIRTSIRKREVIVVYGDFDADGVTATALLVQTLQALGARVVHYIPHRVDEGYGLNMDAVARLARGELNSDPTNRSATGEPDDAALKQFAERGAQLVITVDCGIRSVKEVAHGNDLHLEMIVTDHHALGFGPDGQEELPPALAVINPRRQGDPYPFKDLAGVGLAFKLAQALLRAEADAPVAEREVTLGERDLVDLVALGTVADLAVLLGENRTLVQRGLKELNQTRRPGIRAMLGEAGVPPGKVDATAIGFLLGPRLNAAGRLETAEHSYELLMTDDPTRAGALAMKLGSLNRQRQELTQRLVDRAREQISGPDREHFLYMVSGADFKAGVVGLVAGRLAEELYRPVVVVETGQEETRGSARSIPEFNITAALDECRDLLVRYGGHAAAAGFTVETARLPLLRERLEEIAARKLADQELSPSLAVDCEVHLRDLDFAVQGLLAQLEPFGTSNPQPLLVSRGLVLQECRQVGGQGQHLKLIVRDPEGGRDWECIAFRQGGSYGRLSSPMDLVYSLEVNEFNGRKMLQLNVKDIQPGGPR